MSIKETADVWRLYVREWVIVHTASRHHDSSAGLSGQQAAETSRETFLEAVTWVQDNLAGRVRDDDYQIEGNTDNEAQFWFHVKVFKDNLKGEFKTVSIAEHYAAAQEYEEYTVVPRNSKLDHQIRSYGVKKL